MSKNQNRLDQTLVRRGMVPSRQRGQALIMAGKVLVNNQPAIKAGQPVTDTDQILLKDNDLRYVSRGGLKLEAALQAFQIDPTGFICLDIGASTGGFTDCLLQHGAEKVFALDVGYGQLAWKLRQDPRVLVLERTNVRYASEDIIPESMDLIAVDVSFISLKLVLPQVIQFAKQTAYILALIKPQFEVGKGQVGKGGVIKDPALHKAVIKDISQYAAGIGLQRKALIPSPIKGPKGNREFFIALKCDCLESA